MGLALELLVGFVTAPSTTFTNVTMATGNSLSIRNAPLNSKIYFLTAWSDHQTAGNVEIKSPKLHDNVHGIRFFSVASEVKPRTPWGIKQLLYPQDTLTIQMTGSGTGGDIETMGMLVYYEDLPGAAARLATEDFVKSRIVNLMGVENSIALLTAGGYSGEEAITAELDFMKANTDYALCGYTVSAECAAVRWRGADTGNLGLGGPGDELGADFTNDWFLRLSRLWNLQTVPIFNASNKGAILIDGAQDENGTDVIVTELFAELRP